MRKLIAAGNWKMNKHIGEGRKTASALAEAVGPLEAIELVIAPTFVALHPLAEVLKGSRIQLAGQTMYWAEEGAYTAEIAPSMLTDVGCTYVILGHSERRQYFGETDELVNHKAKVALQHNLTPIVCLGESLEEREAERTDDKVEFQVRSALSGLEPEDAERVVLAYEPIWAIGTGKTATPEQAQQVHALMRDVLSEVCGKKTAEKIRILYGGSVKPNNIAELIAQPDIDGALVGGASLKADSFAEIARAIDAEAHRQKGD